LIQQDNIVILMTELWYIELTCSFTCIIWSAIC